MGKGGWTVVAYGYGVRGVADGDHAPLWMYPLLEERPLDHGDADDSDRLLGQRDESVEGRRARPRSECILTMYATGEKDMRAPGVAAR